MIDITTALTYIKPSELTYQEWINVGMALNDASKSDPSISWEVWDNWSRNDPRYKEGECERKWHSFKSEGITKATIFKMAKDNGYSVFTIDQDQILSWGSYVQQDERQENVNDIKTYIKTLFEPDDLVSFCFDSEYDSEKGKYHPSSQGVYGKRAKDILNDLDYYNGDISKALGDYNYQAGGWIRMNPTDGKGVSDSHITKFNYVLVESDELTIEQQLDKIIELKLPCAAIVKSGGKSLHAIVHIDAKSEREYKERVNWLYDYLDEKGYKVDRNNKNPSRMSRFPSLYRELETQELFTINFGPKSFEEFKKQVDNEDILELPLIESFSEMVKEDPPLAPQLIEGVLRQGHKMIIAGASKAGKSFSLIELALAIVEGKEWLGFKCTQGKVLYINLEIDRASFYHRVQDVYKAHGVDITKDQTHIESLDIWNLRGKAVPLERLSDKIIEAAQDKDYSAIILDPIYKVQSGDENSAGDIAKFTNQLDRIVSELGVSLIYCHHHSKGKQGFKSAVDRSSGSGVFSRDADTIIDMIELEDEQLENREDLKDCTFWQVEGVLREFKPFKPFGVIFDYPLHRIDTQGILKNAHVDGFSSSNKLVQERKDTKKRNMDEFVSAFNELATLTEANKYAVKCSKLEGYLDITNSVLRRRIKTFNQEHGYTYYCRNKIVYKATPDEVEEYYSDVNNILQEI